MSRLLFPQLQHRLLSEGSQQAQAHFVQQACGPLVGGGHIASWPEELAGFAGQAAGIAADVWIAVGGHLAAQLFNFSEALHVDPCSGVFQRGLDLAAVRKDFF